LWLDEILTAAASQASRAADVVTWAQSDINGMPLFLLLTWLLARLGDSEALLRLPSVLAGTLGVVFTVCYVVGCVLAVAWVRRGAELAMAGEGAGIVTAPVNKEAVTLAGVPFTGHTELLADMAASRVAMLLAVLERRFRSSPGAAAYIREVRLSRFAGRQEPPSESGRRALRATLGNGLGPVGRLRALWALPPRIKRS